MAYRGGCRSALASLLLSFFFPLFSPPILAQQISYEYDDLGRLTVVSTPEGIAQYEYDAVGNILRIRTRRYADVPGPVAILSVTPTQGIPGTIVHLYGKGFGTTAADNQVAFNGTAATVTAASPSSLTVTVPAGATSGPITLTSPLGTGTSPEPFTLLAFTLTPDQAVVVRGESVGFRALLGGSPVTDVSWQVNGVVSGNATVGTISPAGLYTAPTAVPSGQPLAVTAVRPSNTSQVARASVQVVDQAAGLAAATPVAVGRIQRAGVEILAGPLTVGVTPTQGARVMSGPLSVTGGPVILAIAPATRTVGTSVGLTLTGGNLQGASAIIALRNGALDNTLSASALTAAPDGTSVSCSLTISGSTPAGARVLQVLTPQGRSMDLDLGTNRFTVGP